MTALFPLSPLNRKLVRDLWHIKGQLLAIILEMGCGIATFILSFGVLDSLKLTRDVYYDQYQFADVFAGLKRAPESIKRQIQEIPGVSAVETRIVFGATVQMAHLPEPVTGRLISLSDKRQALLNNLFLRQGRFPAPDEQDTILANEAFVEAHGLNLGDPVTLVINGHKRSFTIVGVALSPEYVYALAPGSLFPDNRRFGIFWISRRVLEAAVDMDGAFNDVALGLRRNANVAEVQDRLDRILAPYGGLLSYTRKEQISNWFLDNEFKQLSSMGVIGPVIFISVAAFLLNVVMTRLVATQREQIGMLKATGYSNLEISAHYLKMVLVLVLLGGVLGILVGSWMGAGLTRLYAEFFHFPLLRYSFAPQVMVLAVFICAGAAVMGTLLAIRRAAVLPPAEAMRPEAPAIYRQTLVERLGLENVFSHLTRIVLRQLERRPWRALLSVLGIGFSVSILIFAMFMDEALDHLLGVQFDLIQREDAVLNFVEAVPVRALEEIRQMPGVMRVEPIREVSVALNHGPYQKRLALTGLRPDPHLVRDGLGELELHRILDKNLDPVSMPEHGVALSATLAKILRVRTGDILMVDVLEERRPVFFLPVTRIVEDFMGLNAFMDLDRLNAYLNDPPRITGVALMLDPARRAALYQEIRETPMVAALSLLQEARQSFKETVAESLMITVTVNVLFAAIISFGVIYNTARIALSERGRELAALRVLGLTNREVAWLLFGEMSVIVVCALPLGMVLGRGLAEALAASLEAELFRLPVIITPQTYGLAALIVAGCSLVSFFLVWRQVARLDLVTALKGFE